MIVDRYGQYGEGAMAAAALFAAHPVHCEAVSSLVGRFRVYGLWFSFRVYGLGYIVRLSPLVLAGLGWV